MLEKLESYIFYICYSSFRLSCVWCNFSDYVSNITSRSVRFFLLTMMLVLFIDLSCFLLVVFWHFSMYLSRRLLVLHIFMPSHFRHFILFLISLVNFKNCTALLSSVNRYTRIVFFGISCLLMEVHPIDYSGLCSISFSSSCYLSITLATLFDMFAVTVVLMFLLFS